MRNRLTFPLALATALVVVFCGSPPTQAADTPFVHQQMLRSHEGYPPITAEDVGFPTGAQLANRGRSEKPIVMGYLPYWVSAQNLPWRSGIVGPAAERQSPHTHVLFFVLSLHFAAVR